MALAACKDIDAPKPEQLLSEDQVKIETLAGGELGTTFNSGASAFQDPSPAVAIAGMTNEFMYGEYFFEHTFNTSTKPFNGLGPAYVRSSCLDCHPSYGYGKRTERYNASDYGNGYLLVIYDKSDDSYVTSVTGMPQTRANGPFKAPIDEDQIQMHWVRYTDLHGNRFPDGETYELIYPEVSIPLSAFYGGKVISKNGELAEGQYDVRLESTIGIYGTGLIDAIDDADILAEYQKQEKYGVRLNPAIYANGAFTSMYSNTKQGDGTPHARKYTYALSRGPLLDAPGSNAIWNITNVTRSDRRYHYITTFYAQESSKDPEVQENFYKYFPKERFQELTGNEYTGDVEKDIYNYLTGTNLPVEMTDENYADFMIWHRGLAVPAARDLDDPKVQKGHELFRSIGCATCHKPSWTTGDDNVYDPNLFFKNGKKIAAEKEKVMPVYPHQTIWPYSDLVQHKLFMQNDIRTGWCRTTPLWGRGLSLLATGHQDRLHDRRARNVVEAIMWHGTNTESDAYKATENFYNLNKEDRDAVVTFINAI